jgi:hypothetical protein
MQVIFRCCEKEPTISYVNRYKNYSKKTILRKSWLSLNESAADQDAITIIHDEVSPETLAWMYSTCKFGLIRKIVSIEEHSFEHHLHTIVAINELEILAKESPTEYILMIEDDYLFSDDALDVMRGLELWNGFSVPYDYIDRYKNPKPSGVMLGPTCHWRTIDSSTMTVGARGKLWEEVILELKEAAPTSNDKVFEDLYINHKYVCIGPIPGVASHLTEHHSTPYFDVEKRWTSI